MRDSIRVFASTDNVNWIELATNNSIKSTPISTNAELPAYASASGGLYKGDRVNQRVQELFDPAAQRNPSPPTRDNNILMNPRRRPPWDGDKRGLTWATWPENRISAYGSISAPPVRWASAPRLQAGTYLGAVEHRSCRIYKPSRSTASTFTAQPGTPSVPRGTRPQCPRWRRLGHRRRRNVHRRSHTFQFRSPARLPGQLRDSHQRFPNAPTGRRCHLQRDRGKPTAVVPCSATTASRCRSRSTVIAQITDGETFTINGKVFEFDADFNWDSHACPCDVCRHERQSTGRQARDPDHQCRHRRDARASGLSIQLNRPHPRRKASSTAWLSWSSTSADRVQLVGRTAVTQSASPGLILQGSAPVALATIRRGLPNQLVGRAGGCGNRHGAWTPS